MNVRTIHTERLRIPPLRQSTEGKSDPKDNAKAEADGNQVKIPGPLIVSKRGRILEHYTNWRNSSLRGDFGWIEWWDKIPRKADKLWLIVTVPQTDTGSRGEKPKVLEWITAKELGKLTL